MAIAYDTKTNNGGSSNDGTASTWSHTCTGSNLALVVVVAGNIVTVPPTSIAATYNGVALTQDVLYSTTNEEFVWIGHLVNPATGAHTVSVTVTTGSGFDGGYVAFAGSFTGVDQSTPLDGVTPVTAASATTAVTLNITPTTNNAWIVDGCASGNSGTAQVQDAPQTLGAAVAAPTWNFKQSWSYNGPVANSQQSDGWTGASARYRLAAIALRPSSGGDTPIALPVGGLRFTRYAPALQILDPFANDARIVIRKA